MGNAAIETQSERRRWMALALVVTAQFMVILDVTIVNVALPSIQPISASPGKPAVGDQRLRDHLRRHPAAGRPARRPARSPEALRVGLTLFSLSSLLSGFAWSEGSLIGFRAAQGLGAALLVPAALSLLMSTFAEGPERNRALGI